MSQTTDIFKQATKLKLRFSSVRGDLTVEDLWDLPLSSVTGKANLDDIAKAFHAKTVTPGNISFVTEAPAVSDEDAVGFEIVKHIIKVRMDENKAKAEAGKRVERMRVLEEILAKKEQASLENMDAEALRAELAALRAA
jgi:hypothetical protein